MGRLATHLAATVANVDNLPPTNQLERVSLWDAFLPKSSSHPKKVVAEKEEQTPQQAPQQNVSKCLQSQWCDVRRDFKGRKIIVAHKEPCYGNGPNANGDGKGGTEDVKEGGTGGGIGGVTDAGKKRDGGKNGDNGGENSGDAGGDEKKPHELTPEEDEKLKALKSEGKSWKDISQEMGKPIGFLRERWKVVNPAKAEGQANEGDKNKKNGGDGNNKKKDDAEQANEDADKKAEEPKKLTKKEKKATKHDAKQEAAAETKPAEKEEKKGEKKAKSASGGKPASEARFTMSEWVTLQEDDLFSFGELQLLSELIAQYDAGRWQMVASRFFDKTGRRVHADDVRDKFMGAMA